MHVIPVQKVKDMMVMGRLASFVGKAQACWWFCHQESLVRVVWHESMTEAPLHVCRGPQPFSAEGTAW